MSERATEARDEDETREREREREREETRECEKRKKYHLCKHLANLCFGSNRISTSGEDLLQTTQKLLIATNDHFGIRENTVQHLFGNDLHSAKWKDEYL